MTNRVQQKTNGAINEKNDSNDFHGATPYADILAYTIFSWCPP